MRVYDARRRRGAAGRRFHPGGDAAAVAVRLPAVLGAGGYTVTYRVVSADSHPISGGFVFSVGEDAARARPGVAELLGDQQAGPSPRSPSPPRAPCRTGRSRSGSGCSLVLLLAWRPALRATGAGEAAAGAFAARAACCCSRPGSRAP